MSFLAETNPRWFTIPPHRPFAEDLARGLAMAVGGGPEALADAVLLSPTRRAGREVAHAFLATGAASAALLPQIRPLGDLDEGEPPFEPGDIALGVPPAISPWRRRFELARLVKTYEGRLERDLDAAGALTFADALGRFLDSCFIEECADPDRIDSLVADDHAEHWQLSADFLKLALVQWRRRLDDLGLMDVAERRVALLNRLAETWEARPPPGLLIAAGSTGTAPATAKLLKAIAKAPQGAVVLPGLDVELADDAWDEVGDQHPQGSMKRLLVRAAIERGDVKPWPESLAPDRRARWRRRVINEALRPPERTSDWLHVVAELRKEGERTEVGGEDPVADGLQGLSLVAARSEEEAALAAALLLRETLETEGATAALITPDLALARRVSARLSRWGVEADTSAGSPLAACPVAVMASRVAACAADPQDTIALLALLKSPLTRLGLGSNTLERSRWVLERRGFRVPREASLEALEAKLSEQPGALELLKKLRMALAPVTTVFADGLASAPDAARALAEAMEELAKGPGRGGTGPLWAGVAGEAMSALIAAVIEEGELLPPVSAEGFAAFLQALIDGETVRAAAAAHPRIRILGAIEARLVRADRLILAGLEEGMWPAGAPIDPFLSRPMRAEMGLPAPERRTGLAAHDFAQAASAPEVVLLRSERRGGAPAVASRWLWRLETLVRGAGLDLPGRPDILAMARALDAPVRDPPPHLQPAARPAPRPAFAERPRNLPVTRIETLVRDPYAIYAQYVLGLRPLDRPDAPMEARLRGTAIHAALETYSKAWPFEGDPAAAFVDLYLAKLRENGVSETALAREAPLARKAGGWVAEFERERRAAGAAVLLEAQGQATFTVGDALFTLTAKSDRIEVAGGVAHVIDFKTGRAPSQKEVATGFSPQLTLTAWILSQGGFADLGALGPGDLTYVRLTGREPPGEVVVRGEAGADSLQLMTEAAEGLKRLIARFDDEATPYASRTAPQFAEAKGEDYDHLARVREWISAEGEEDAEEVE